MSVSKAETSKGFYTRQSSGLVRDISPASSVGLNIAFASIPLALLVATEAPFAFPGASPLWTTVICAGLCIFPTLLYSMFTTVMPRSGGDYVFVGRTLHPWVGFAANFSIMAWYVLVMAYYGYLIVPLGVSSALSTIGVVTNDPALVSMAAAAASNEWLQFVVGAAFLFGGYLLMSLNLRRMLKVQNVLFLFSLVAVVIALFLLLANGRAAFVSDVSAFGGNYNGILAAATKQGFTGNVGFNLGQTLLATPLAFATFGYIIVTCYAGGELRGLKQSAGRNSMLVALLVVGVVMALIMGLSDRTFGPQFLGAATFLSNAGSKAYPFGAPSFFFLFVAMLTRSTPLIVIMSLSFIASLIVAIPVTYLITTRTLFAWSFDRIFPDRIAEVNPRTHSPLVANLIVFLAGLVFLAVIIFVGGFLQLLFTAGMAEILTFLVVSIAGIVLPWRKPDLYATSGIRQRWLGIPSISTVGVLSFLIYGFFFVSYATVSALGANAPAGIAATIIIALLGILIYPVSRYLNRRRGVDLSLAFKELPPE